jgi:hypothetical protein
MEEQVEFPLQFFIFTGNNCGFTDLFKLVGEKLFASASRAPLSKAAILCGSFIETIRSCNRTPIESGITVQQRDDYRS